MTSYRSVPIKEQFTQDMTLMQKFA